MAGPRERKKLQTRSIAEDPRERFIRTTNTPSHPNYHQQRWEKAGGSGAYPVLTDERPSIDQLPRTIPYFPGGESTGRHYGIDQYWPHTKPAWLEAGTKWKQNIPLMLRSLRQRDEFKDWSDDELTHYMHRTFSNRGGLMSLV